jgi:hypothetical protein
MQDRTLRSTPWMIVLALACVAGTGTYFARASIAPAPQVAALAPTAAPARAYAAPLAIDVPAAGRVTAALYTHAGALVRTLAHDVALPAGRTALAWDGCDEQGRPAPAGAYALKLQVTSPRVRAMRVTTVAWPAGS